MSYVDPPTFIPDDILTAAQLNVLGDDIRAIYAQSVANTFDGVALLRTSNLSCATATSVTVPWESAPLDTNGWWASGTDIVVPAGTVPAGFSSVSIQCQGTVRFAANGTGTRSIQFLINGSVVEVIAAVSALSGETTTVATFVWIAAAVDGDVIHLQVAQTSGSTLNASYIAAHINRLGANV